MSTGNSDASGQSNHDDQPKKVSPLRRKLFAFGALALASLAIGPMVTQVVGEAASGVTSKRAVDWAAVATASGSKFEGSSQCMSCHGSGADKAPKDRKAAIANAASVWSQSDKHSNAYKTLTKPASAAILKAMNVTGDAKTNETCLECHAVKGVTADLKGSGFALAEGNSCNSCHGPSSKWDKPHATPGWTQARRDEFHGDHDKLLMTWGIFDTKPLSARTEMCAGCHLQIDGTLVKAGHPAPNFEIGYFSEVEPRHWIAEPDFDGAKAWLIGQTICLNDAMSQLADRASGKDADLIAAAYTQAAAHLWVLRDAADAMGLDKAALDAHATKLKSLAAKPADNAAAIATEATAIATDAKAMQTKAEAYTAKQADVAKAMAAIVADADLATLNDAAAAKDRSFGAFGENQQGFALFTLAKAYESGTKAPAAVSDMVKKSLLAAYPKKPAMDVAAYEKALGDVKAKLPAQ